jgi:hypothetical protein
MSAVAEEQGPSPFKDAVDAPTTAAAVDNVSNESPPPKANVVAFRRKSAPSPLANKRKTQ